MSAVSLPADGADVPACRDTYYRLADGVEGRKLTEHIPLQWEGTAPDRTTWLFHYRHCMWSLNVESLNPSRDWTAHGTCGTEYTYISDAVAVPLIVALLRLYALHDETSRY